MGAAALLARSEDPTLGLLVLRVLPRCGAPGVEYLLNRAKSKLRVQRAYCRVANVRQDFLHKLSDRLAASARLIVLEDLSLKAAAALGP